MVNRFPGFELCYSRLAFSTVYLVVELITTMPENLFNDASIGRRVGPIAIVALVTSLGRVPGSLKEFGCVSKIQSKFHDKIESLSNS